MTVTAKRTWKFNAAAPGAAETMASAASCAAAARRLGLNRSTVTRLVRAGKLPAPGGRRNRVVVVDASSLDALEAVPATGWADVVRAQYALSATELTLVELADAALTLARDTALTPSVRLTAMSKFAWLVQQLHLEAVDDGKAESPFRRIG